jgi:diguanylate cyclase (GGDEF)-like protein
MPPAPPHPEEERRLAALRACHVLDTPPDPRFDTLVRFAADLFEAPIALLSLIDADRQWFKAAVGFHAKQTARAHAFSAHAILAGEAVTVVEDAAADPRFADNPFVLAGPQLRFYAGAPVLSEEGLPLGVLCILDRERRTLDGAGRRRLQALAATAASLLQMHRDAALLEQAATHDPLTGLVNRRRFEAALQGAAEQALAGRPCAVLHIDLDLFSRVNATLGQHGGDAVLQEAARRLAEAVRAGDLVARLGSDEFAVLLAGPADAKAADATARRILERFAAPVLIGEAAPRLRASIGIALCPTDAIAPGAVMRAAEAAVAHAKAEGRGRVATATGPPAARPRRRSGRGGGASLEQELRRAIGRERLALQWQPYFDARHGGIVGCEALVRWPSGTPPSVFVPLAEVTGLAGRLDEFVLQRACTEAANLPAHWRVAVNLSPHWFGSGELPALVRRTLAETGLNPRRLEVELTERTLVEQPQGVRGCLDALHELGVAVALDDFGTGYSSLGYLQRFRFDKLKLDRAFVVGLREGERAQAVARAIIQLGRALEMAVCAEGVETPAQLEFLRGEGCDLLQGYLLGMPTSLAELTRLAQAG